MGRDTREWGEAATGRAGGHTRGQGHAWAGTRAGRARVALTGDGLSPVVFGGVPGQHGPVLPHRGDAHGLGGVRHVCGDTRGHALARGGGHTHTHASPATPVSPCPLLTDHLDEDGGRVLPHGVRYPDGVTSFVPALGALDDEAAQLLLLLQAGATLLRRKYLGDVGTRGRVMGTRGGVTGSWGHRRGATGTGMRHGWTRGSPGAGGHGTPPPQGGDTGGHTHTRVSPHRLSSR